LNEEHNLVAQFLRAYSGPIQQGAAPLTWPPENSVKPSRPVKKETDVISTRKFKLEKQAGLLFKKLKEFKEISDSTTFLDFVIQSFSRREWKWINHVEWDRVEDSHAAGKFRGTAGKVWKGVLLTIATDDLDKSAIVLKISTPAWVWPLTALISVFFSCFGAWLFPPIVLAFYLVMKFYSFPKVLKAIEEEIRFFVSSF
jgi:hypothetical protein